MSLTVVRLDSLRSGDAGTLRASASLFVYNYIEIMKLVVDETDTGVEIVGRLVSSLI